MGTAAFNSFRHQWSWLAAILIAISTGSLAAKNPPKPGPMVGKTAPEFHLQGIYDEAYSLETFKGHILVMQFGASW
ncbi:MAG TPA: hypothetical protein VMB80_11910 [Candidatus Acidoferrum sp.]|nr:hypothetical protein [Candidatus Acidoferrum sp.]